MPGETFTFTCMVKPAWSGSLDTETMTITTVDNCTYKDVYYNGGSSMRLFEQEDVRGMDFSEISFPNVTRCYDGKFYLHMIIKVHKEERRVYFRRVV
jgi:hypothetical protein